MLPIHCIRTFSYYWRKQICCLHPFRPSKKFFQFLISISNPSSWITIRKIRDIHGDLYLKNIFIVEDRRYYLYDRIEFNDSLRYADVGEDVAHLSMDLEYHNRQDLQTNFVNDYVSRSNDYSLEKILEFLICNKAFVRAKVLSFQARYESAGSKKFILLKEADAHLFLENSIFKIFDTRK